MSNTGLRAWWTARVFTLDARSLALGRVLLGLLLLADLALRAGDLEAHYTDAGVLPRAALELRAWDFSWSLHALWGGAWWQLVLFAVHAAFALALVVGWRTRWATLGAWVLTCSLHARNPLLRDLQDDLLRVLLFFGLFLPLGRATSMDARVGREAGDRSVHDIGSVAWIAQLCVVHCIAAGALVLSPAWRGSPGAALAWSLRDHPTPMGAWVPPAPGLFAWMSLGAVGLALLAPLMLLVPWRSSRWRGAVIGAVVVASLAFAACLQLGVLPYLVAAAWLSLLPGSFWRRVPFVAAAAAPAPNLRIGFWRRWLARWHHLFPAAGLALSVLGNVPTFVPRARILVRDLVGVVGLQQAWAVTAGAATGRHASVVVTGRRADGSRLAAPDPAAAGMARDRLPLDWIPQSHRWRCYLEAVAVEWPATSPRVTMVRQSRAAHLARSCRTWNVGEARVVEVELTLQEPSPGPSAPRALGSLGCAERR